MTYQKTEIEQARADMVKRFRNAIRFEHSIAADHELNGLLPEAEKLFNAAVQRGELPDAGEIWTQLGRAALHE